MFVKIEIAGYIETVTGLHIGGSDAFSAIGAIDSPVVRDGRTNAPMIPGSSLKGKMRTLLAKRYNAKAAKSPDHDDIKILSLFGSAKNTEAKTGRLIFSDMVVSNTKEIVAAGMTGVTEVKFENSINRITAVANPRQIERVIRGAEFPLSIIYEYYAEEQPEDAGKKIAEDFAIICEGFRLLQYDYLGGSGTRGYGKIKFKDLKAETVIGELEESVIKNCNALLASV